MVEFLFKNIMKKYNYSHLRFQTLCIHFVARGTKHYLLLLSTQNPLTLMDIMHL